MVLLKAIVARRKVIQALIAVLILAAIFYFQINLLYVLAAGIVAGILFGKVFCRWMCPMGFLMELMLGGDSGDTKEQMYNYHKTGCPIAWIGGWLNKFSLFKIRRDPAKCTDCGICDRTCYITTFDQQYSHYRKGKKTPGSHFSCSKCLACVAECPTKSMKYKVSGKEGQRMIPLDNGGKT